VLGLTEIITSTLWKANTHYHSNAFVVWVFVQTIVADKKKREKDDFFLGKVIFYHKKLN
jgi:hypothetical protein